MHRHRRRLGWTQVRLAAALGVDANTVARWERGVMRINEPVARLMRYVCADPTLRPPGDAR
jgi:DNA-binding transcriptional regulator YiaG